MFFLKNLLKKDKKPLADLAPEGGVRLTFSVKLTTSLFFLVKFLDENNNPKIVEVTGNSWSWENQVFGNRQNQISVFIRNTAMGSGTLRITRTISEEITQVEIDFLGCPFFGRWYSLE